MFTGLFDDLPRFFMRWGTDEKDPWRGSAGTFAELFKKEFMEVGAICSWRKKGAGAQYNMSSNCVELRTEHGEILATIRVHGTLDIPDAAVVHVHSLIEHEKEALRRRLPIPITFTGNVT